MFKLPYDIIILDLEANQPSQNIIEIGAVRLLRDGSLHPDEFSMLCNPYEKLGSIKNGTMTITELTGITQDMVDSAPAGDYVAQEFERWAYSQSKNFVLASWGIWDIPVLQKHYNDHTLPYPFRNKTFDIKSMVVFYSGLTRKRYKTDGLTNMSTCWGVGPLKVKHRALDDARNTAFLLQHLINHHDRHTEALTTALRMADHTFKP